jgi:hypothetical protein
MRSSTFGAGAGLVALLWATTASAQPGDATARAEVAFKEAMALHAAGRDVEACPRFAESKQLAPAIGVTLYLADCYERTGRKASAWREFREAETLARTHGDKREDVAAQRAAALEPQLNRLTVDVPASAAKSGADLQLDGSALPQSFWGAPLAVDPGDHVVTMASPGQALQTFAVHVDASNLSTVAHVGGAEGAGAGPVLAPAPAPADGASTGTGATAAAGIVTSGGSVGRWAGGGLMVAGAISIGIGTWLVTSKERDMVNGQLCDPHLHDGAVPGAIIAYSAGGVALISGIVLYYVNRPGRNEVSLTPAYVPGGGGAILRATF